MGIRNLTVSISGHGKSQSAQKVNHDWWFHLPSGASKKTNGDRTLYYENLKLTDVSFDISDWPSGWYTISMAQDAELSSASVIRLEEAATTYTSVYIKNDWGTGINSYVSKQSHDICLPRSSDCTNELVFRPDEQVHFSHNIYNNPSAGGNIIAKNAISYTIYHDEGWISSDSNDSTSSRSSNNSAITSGNTYVIKRTWPQAENSRAVNSTQGTA